MRRHGRLPGLPVRRRSVSAGISDAAAALMAYLLLGELGSGGRYARLAEEAHQVLAEVREQAPGGRASRALCGRLAELADAIGAVAGSELLVVKLIDLGRAVERGERERAAASPAVRSAQRPQGGRRDRHGLCLAYSAPDGAQ